MILKLNDDNRRRRQLLFTVSQVEYTTLFLVGQGRLIAAHYVFDKLWLLTGSRTRLSDIQNDPNL